MGLRIGYRCPLAAIAAAVLAAAGCGGGSGEKAASRGDVDAGKRTFLSAGCGRCHILKAAGTTGILGGSLDLRPQKFDDVVARVRDGGGGMPSFAKKLSPAQIDDVAAFVAHATER